MSLVGLCSVPLFRFLKTPQIAPPAPAPKTTIRFFPVLVARVLSPWGLMYLQSYVDTVHSSTYPSRQLSVHILWFFGAVFNWVLWALVILLSIVSVSFDLEHLINLGYVAYGAAEHVMRISIPLLVSSILAFLFFGIWQYSLKESLTDYRVLAARPVVVSAVAEGLSLWPYRKAALSSLASLLLQIPFTIFVFLINLGSGV